MANFLLNLLFSLTYTEEKSKPITASLFLSLFWCALCPVFGQNPSNQTRPLDEKFTFYHMDVDDGLSNNIVKTIKQDSLGFIWIGTSDGLNRYDGKEFKVYRKETSAISDNYLQKIELSNSGKLLLGTDRGFNIYDPVLDRFTLFSAQDGDLPNGINSFAEGENGLLYVGVYGYGVYAIAGNVIKHFYSNGYQSPNRIASNETSCLAKESDTILWVGSFNYGLSRINLQTNKAEAIGCKEFIGCKINTIYVDSDKNIWIGTQKGLSVIGANGSEYFLGTSTHQKGLSDNEVLAIVEDDLGKIWIGTHDGGLNIINKKEFLSRANDLTVRWYLPKEDGSSIYNATVSALYKDRDGNIWIGTNAGIDFVTPGGGPIKLLKSTLPNSEKILHNRITALAESHTGKIWIGTDGGGLDYFDPQTANLDYAKFGQNAYLKTKQILSIIEDQKKRVWVGTYQKGINRYDPETSSWSYYLQGSQAEGNDVRVLFEAKNGEIWAGTNRGGLFKYQEKSDNFKYVASLGKMDIRDIDQDTTGNLWLGTYGNGIIHYIEETDEFTSYHNGNLEGLTSNVVFCLTVLNNGEIVAGTKYGGIIQFKPGEWKALNFTESDGLSNNTVNSIVKYDDDDLWLGTFKGISKYNTHTHEIESWNAYTNIQKSEYNAGAALKSKTGHLYLGGNRGLNIFDPEKITETQTPSPIVIKDLLILNESVAVLPEVENALLDKSILYKDKIVLPHDKSLFSLDFVSLKFPYADNENYSYKLEGFDNSWIDLKNANRISFSNLPPGNYELKIRSHSKVAPHGIKSIQISVLPPWWKTVPAYLLYILLIAAVVIALLKYYSERIYLKNSLIFEKKQRNLEKDLNEERIRFYTGFSHELKTPLTLILAPLESLINQVNSKEQRSQLKLIERNAHKLLTFINKLLEFRNSEEGLSNLDVAQYNLSKQISKWIRAYEPLARNKGIDLFLALPAEKVYVHCDIEKVQIIFNNLVSNAIKHTPADASVKISLEKNEEEVILKVKDAGTGIKAGDLDQIFEWYYQSNSSIKKEGTGIGLALSKRFAELHLGSINVESTLGEGSTFTVKLHAGDKLLTEKQKEEVLQHPVNEKEVNNGIDPSVSTTPVASTEVLLKAKPNRKIILLIDDNPDIIQFLDISLRGEYDLINAVDGEEGVRKAKKYVPDIIVSDIMMPKKNGIDLCHELKNNKETSHIPIILLSAKSNFEMIETGYQEGADDYMVKPFSLSVLQARIKNLIDNRRKLRDRFNENKDIQSTLSPADSLILKKEKEFLKEFESIILGSLDQENKSVEEIAQDLGMSRSSLFRKIKAITGQSINEYIRNIKIERAAYLIEKENYNISQASFEVGFSNLKYFRKIFKEKYGKTPSALKKM